MLDRSGGRAVPQIFINDDCIGGYTELATLESNGQLDKLLDQPSSDS
jgi:glutaredoxin 3